MAYVLCHSNGATIVRLRDIQRGAASVTLNGHYIGNVTAVEADDEDGVGRRLWCVRSRGRIWDGGRPCAPPISGPSGR